jgi:hypothetical protein
MIEIDKFKICKVNIANIFFILLFDFFSVNIINVSVGLNDLFKLLYNLI